MIRPVMRAGKRIRKTKTSPSVSTVELARSSMAERIDVGLAMRLPDERGEAHGAVLGGLEAGAPAGPDGEPLVAVAHGGDQAPAVEELVDERAGHRSLDGGGDVDRVVGRVLGTPARAVADDQRDVGDARAGQRGRGGRAQLRMALDAPHVRG